MDRQQEFNEYGYKKYYCDYQTFFSDLLHRMKKVGIDINEMVNGIFYMEK